MGPCRPWIWHRHALNAHSAQPISHCQATPDGHEDDNDGHHRHPEPGVSFFGHQLSLHLGEPFAVTNTGKVGEHWVPMPHFGVVLEMPDWLALKARLEDRRVDFVMVPTRRFVGTPGEQATMFFLDPSGNPIEIKGFTDWASVYAV